MQNLCPLQHIEEKTLYPKWNKGTDKKCKKGQNPIQKKPQKAKCVCEIFRCKHRAACHQEFFLLTSHTCHWRKVSGQKRRFFFFKSSSLPATFSTVEAGNSGCWEKEEIFAKGGPSWLTPLSSQERKKTKLKLIDGGRPERRRRRLFR